MDKVLVRVIVPSLNIQIDTLIPKYSLVEVIIGLLEEALSGYTDNCYIPTGSELLCWNRKGIVLNRNKTIFDYGIQNGEVLYFY